MVTRQVGHSSAALPAGVHPKMQGMRLARCRKALCLRCPSKDCVKDYAAHNATITAAMLCASGKSAAGITDACYGDSGGPLVCKEDDRYVVRGITSWGLGCASEKFPGVYSRVTKALSWIHDTMAGKNSALEDPVDFHGAMWTITSGPCTMDASRCISSPSFPSNYSINSFCFIRVNASSAVPIRVEEFATEPGFDQMLLNCRSFSGHESPAGITPFTDIMWVSDVRGGGQRLEDMSRRLNTVKTGIPLSMLP